MGGSHVETFEGLGAGRPFGVDAGGGVEHGGAEILVVFVGVDLSGGGNTVWARVWMLDLDLTRLRDLL